MIRFQRLGKKKSPAYRLVISEKARDPQAKSIEILGRYNPVANPKEVELKVDRIKHWLSMGAQPSESVQNLLMAQGIMKADKKAKSVKLSNKRRTKIEAKQAEEAEKKKAAAEAKREAEEAAKAEAEAAKEAAKAEAEAAKKAEEEAAAAPAAEEAPTEEPAKEEAPAEAPPEEEKKEEAAA